MPSGVYERKPSHYDWMKGDSNPAKRPEVREILKRKLPKAIKNSYTPELRKLRKEQQKKNWKNPKYRQSIIKAISNVWKRESYRETMVRKFKKLRGTKAYKEMARDRFLGDKNPTKKFYVRKKLSEKAKVNNIGKKNPMFGKKHKQKSKEIMREKAVLRRGKYPKCNTTIELKIQNILTENKIVFETEKPLEKITRADIFIKPNIVIFCDGDYWHSYPKGTNLDKKITKILLKKGYLVLRFWERDIHNDISLCFKKIQEVLM